MLALQGDSWGANNNPISLSRRDGLLLGWYRNRHGSRRNGLLHGWYLNSHIFGACTSSLVAGAIDYAVDITLASTGPTLSSVAALGSPTVAEVGPTP